MSTSDLVTLVHLGDSMPSVDFLQPRLRGARFESGGIPLEFLPDLTALRKMIVEVARWQYLESNPGRQRSPSDFDKVDLELVGVESGSAMPIIKLTATQSVLEGQVPYQKFFEDARERIVSTISRVAQDGQLPSDEYLPHKMLKHFNHIGHNLRDDESLELNTFARQKPAKLTNRVRSKILELASVAKSASTTVLRGLVHKIDQKNMTFSLQPIFGSLVKGQIPNHHYGIIMKAFNGYKSDVKVQIQGTARYNLDNHIDRIEQITDVRILKQLDVPAQLDKLRGMKNGWLDGDGVAPSHHGLDWLSRVFKKYYPDDAVPPHTYPAPDGGIDMEWSVAEREISLEINLEKHNGEWIWYDIGTGSSDERVLNLDKSSSWKWIADQICNMEKT